MSSTSFLLKSAAGTRQADGEFVTDYRQRLALEEYERAEKKRLELADQRSTLNAPDARIRAWEGAPPAPAFRSETSRAGCDRGRDAAHSR